MKMYIVYDESGTILHTHTFYVLGNDEPVAATDEEILAVMGSDREPDVTLRVALVPDDIDVRDRTRSLQVDAASGRPYAVDRRRPRTAAAESAAS